MPVRKFGVGVLIEEEKNVRIWHSLLECWDSCALSMNWLTSSNTSEGRCDSNSSWSFSACVLSALMVKLICLTFVGSVLT